MLNCVLLVQGAALMMSIGKSTDEGTIQQSSIYVHPLQCLHYKKLQQFTEKDTLGNSCILVTNVGSIIHLGAACITI